MRMSSRSRRRPSNGSPSSGGDAGSAARTAPGSTARARGTRRRAPGNRRPSRARRRRRAESRSPAQHSLDVPPRARVDDVVGGQPRGAPARRRARGSAARGRGARPSRRRFRRRLRPPLARVSIRSSRSGCELISRNLPFSRQPRRPRTRSRCRRVAAVELAAGGMADAIDVGVLERGDHPLREPVARLVESRVDRCHHPVALGRTSSGSPPTRPRGCRPPLRKGRASLRALIDPRDRLRLELERPSFSRLAWSQMAM